MYKVERAIIMAAGYGDRMKPVTLKTPKPLVCVNGKRMIETVIDGLRYNGICEIYIVTGYLNEQFNILIEKYDGIKLIYNPYYDSCNNISSLYMAKDYLENSIILDGDQIVYNPDILKKEFEKSGYNAVFTQDHTNEWIMRLEKGRVVSCSRNGGKNGWQLYSISRWNDKDGKKLRELITYEFEITKNRQIYWDDVPMFLYSKEFDLGIIEMNKEDIVEIDDINELINIDNSYAKELEN